MSSGRWRGGSQSHIRRTIKGATSAGLDIERVDVRPDGVVSVILKGAGPALVQTPSDLDSWLKKQEDDN
jgi:hypothetical protein